MLVTFKTDAYANITMFGDIAIRLLKLMGHSGTVPSAIRAEDVPEALENLRRGLEAHGAEAAETNPPRDERTQEKRQPIVLSQRAWPLVELLEAAAAGPRRDDGDDRRTGGADRVQRQFPEGRRATQAG